MPTRIAEVVRRQYGEVDNFRVADNTSGTSLGNYRPSVGRGQVLLPVGTAPEEKDIDHIGGRQISCRDNRKRSIARNRFVRDSL